MTDEEIVAIRDAHMGLQGEKFDCLAFARAVISAVTSKRIWAVGTPTEHGYWMPEGFYWTEQEARTAALPNQFIVLCGIGTPLPAEAIDAEVLYYPNEETWEQSALYRMRQPNAKLTGRDYDD